MRKGGPTSLPQAKGGMGGGVWARAADCMELLFRGAWMDLSNRANFQDVLKFHAGLQENHVTAPAGPALRKEVHVTALAGRPCEENHVTAPAGRPCEKKILTPPRPPGPCEKSLTPPRPAGRGWIFLLSYPFT